MTRNRLIAFYEQRIKSTNKIIDSLNELKKTNLTTPNIDREIDIQTGECEFFIDTLFFLMSINSVEISDEQRKIFREELQKAHTEALKPKIDTEKVIKGEPIAVEHGGLL